MDIKERIAAFLEQHNIIVTVKRVGFTRQEVEREVYSVRNNNKFDVKVQYNKRYRVFPVYTGVGWTEITPEHAVRDILRHVNEIGGAPTFNYWFKQCSGNEMYRTLLEGREDKESKRDTMNFVKGYYGHCKSIEDKMHELLGEELFESFYNLNEGDA